MRSFLRKYKYVIVTLIITILIIVFFIFRDWDIKQGNKVIAKIENYKSVQGKLPESLVDVEYEVSESAKYFYEKSDTGNYTVYFSSGFDENWFYNSVNKLWQINQSDWTHYIRYENGAKIMDKNLLEDDIQKLMLSDHLYPFELFKLSAYNEIYLKRFPNDPFGEKMHNETLNKYGPCFGIPGNTCTE